MNATEGIDAIWIHARPGMAGNSRRPGEITAKFIEVLRGAGFSEDEARKANVHELARSGARRDAAVPTTDILPFVNASASDSRGAQVGNIAAGQLAAGLRFAARQRTVWVLPARGTLGVVANNPRFISSPVRIGLTRIARTPHVVTAPTQLGLRGVSAQSRIVTVPARAVLYALNVNPLVGPAAVAASAAATLGVRELSGDIARASLAIARDDPTLALAATRAWVATTQRDPVVALRVARTTTTILRDDPALVALAARTGANVTLSIVATLGGTLLRSHRA